MISLARKIFLVWSSNDSRFSFFSSVFLQQQSTSLATVKAMMMAPTETMSGVSIFGISPLESFVLLLSAPGNKMFVHEKKIMMKHQIQVHFSSVNAQKIVKRASQQSWVLEKYVTDKV